MLFGTSLRNLLISVPRPPSNKAAERHVAKLGVTVGGGVNWSITFFFGGLGVKIISSIHQISELYCGLSLPPLCNTRISKQSTCSLWFAWARPKIVFHVQVLQSSGVGMYGTPCASAIWSTSPSYLHVRFSGSIRIISFRTAMSIAWLANRI